MARVAALIPLRQGVFEATQVLYGASSASLGAWAVLDPDPSSPKAPWVAGVRVSAQEMATVRGKSEEGAWRELLRVLCVRLCQDAWNRMVKVDRIQRTLGRHLVGSGTVTKLDLLVQRL